MSDVTVTLTVGTTVHYWFIPVVAEASSIIVPNPVYGWTTPDDGETSTTLSLVLDDGCTWYVRMDFRGAPPITFDSFQPSDGDLLSQLLAQGWIAL